MKTNIAFIALHISLYTLRRIFIQFLFYIFCIFLVTGCKKEITDIPADENITADKSASVEASPTVKFTFPNKEDTVLGTITIKIKATSTATIDSVQCKINGVFYASKTAAPYNFEWKTDSLMNGTHQLQATVFDHAGNTKTKKIVVHILNPGVLSMEQDLLTLINAERNRRGIPSLLFNTKILKAARSHATDMADNDFYSHIGSDQSTLGDRLTAAGYPWFIAEENLSAGLSTATEVYNQWYQNQGQRNIILNNTTSDAAVGVGYNFKSTYKYYWELNTGRTN